MIPQYGAALADLSDGLVDWRLWTRYGWQEVKRRYRRTVLGPFWATASLAIFLFSLGYIWAHLWNQDPTTYLPYLGSGMITWVMISAMISEGATVFTSGEGLIKQIQFPYSILVYTLVWRNMIIFFHNLSIYAVIMLWSGTPIGLSVFLAIPALLVIAINGGWIALLIGLLCTRFRDIGQIVVSVLQIVLFVTPIFYPRQSLGPNMQEFTHYNIIFHLVDVMRMPLLGKEPEPWSWEFGLLFAAFGWTVTFVVFSFFRRRIAYWI
jgi:lipopolysaccharide transport system permease protein